MICLAPCLANLSCFICRCNNLSSNTVCFQLWYKNQTHASSPTKTVSRTVWSINSIWIYSSCCTPGKQITWKTSETVSTSLLCWTSPGRLTRLGFKSISSTRMAPILPIDSNWPPASLNTKQVVPSYVSPIHFIWVTQFKSNLYHLRNNIRTSALVFYRRKSFKIN